MEGAATVVTTLNWATTLSGINWNDMISSWTSVIPVVVPILGIAYGIKAGWKFARKQMKSISRGA